MFRLWNKALALPLPLAAKKRKKKNELEIQKLISGFKIKLYQISYITRVFFPLKENNFSLFKIVLITQSSELQSEELVEMV